MTLVLLTLAYLEVQKTTASMPPTPAPDLTIARLMTIGEDDPACVIANEFMNEDVVQKTVTQNGRSEIRYLKDYVRQCSNRVQRTLNMVEPEVRRWCSHRNVNLRFAELCHEWEKNQNDYISAISEIDEPTLRAYENFIADREY